MTDSDVLLMIEDRKAHGQRIGLCNGVFDLLHAGHVRFLHQAADCCDHLVIGLNNDASAAALDKGPGRPFNDLETRRFMLDTLDLDASVLEFGGDVAKLVQIVRPDVIIRGRGQKLTFVEQELNHTEPNRIVWRDGGQTTTTSIVNRILAAHRQAKHD